MKIQFRSILFALVLPLAACGGDGETRTVSSTPFDSFKITPKPEAPVTTPVDAKTDEKPALVALPTPAKFDDALALGR